MWTLNRVNDSLCNLEDVYGVEYSEGTHLYLPLDSWGFEGQMYARLCRFVKFQGPCQDS